jgi:hypothetical protein
MKSDLGEIWLLLRVLITHDLISIVLHIVPKRERVIVLNRLSAILIEQSSFAITTPKAAS